MAEFESGVADSRECLCMTIAAMLQGHGNAQKTGSRFGKAL
jgi:hypothetical protein